uniref:Uncharacterized protein n=1 Tax=Rhabditophanes sp. KR3021 TaxID=114890 RepID=A0AC35U7F5_9BILA
MVFTRPSNNNRRKRRNKSRWKRIGDFRQRFPCPASPHKRQRTLPIYDDTRAIVASSCHKIYEQALVNHFNMQIRKLFEFGVSTTLYYLLYGQKKTTKRNVLEKTMYLDIIKEKHRTKGPR